MLTKAKPKKPSTTAKKKPAAKKKPTAPKAAPRRERFVKH
jgi:hypothetical protein